MCLYYVNVYFYNDVQSFIVIIIIPVLCSIIHDHLECFLVHMSNHRIRQEPLARVIVAKTSGVGR